MAEDEGPDRRPSRWVAFGKLRVAVRRSDRRGGGPTLVGRVAVALGGAIDWLIRRRGYRSYCLDCRKMVWLINGKGAAVGEITRSETEGSRAGGGGDCG